MTDTLAAALTKLSDFTQPPPQVQIIYCPLRHAEGLDAEYTAKPHKQQEVGE